MKKYLALLLIAIYVSTSLAAAPTVVSAKIEPEKAKNGDPITFTIEFSGKADDIQMVEIMVRENPYEAPEMFLSPLKDSDKNVWGLKAEVPFEAPVQVYHLEIKALGNDGKEIVTKEYKDQQWGKAGLLVFEIVE